MLVKSALLRLRRASQVSIRYANPLLGAKRRKIPAGRQDIIDPALD
jgi:hypothetical protein